jgi:hypothetical protein
MNKPAKTYPRPLADIVGRAFKDVFARQGFASAELVTYWADIVGAEIAACAEPVKLQWPRLREGDAPEPAILVLRVEGPAAIEIQHLAPVILERINRFLGWRAVAKLSLRQAPLARATRRERPAAPTLDETTAVAATLRDVKDEPLREALARLGAAVRRVR